MPLRGKLPHVDADFRQKILGGTLVNARDRGQALHRLGKRAWQHRGDSFTQPGDPGLVLLDLLQQQLQQEAVMVGHTPTQGQL